MLRTTVVQLLLTAFCLVTSAEAAEHGVIVLYHHVAEDTPPSTSIAPEQFRRHLEYLRDNGFRVMRLDAMLTALQTRETLPDRAVAITFDDGYASIYDTAFPMLQEFGMPFALFLSTGPIDRNQRGYMNWEQVRTLSEAGVLIGNHMVEHPYLLDREDGENQADWLQRRRLELLEAERRIAEETGQSHRLLAYPYGEYDQELKALLRQEGFLGLAQNSGAVGYDSDFQALPRYPLASIYADLDTASTKFESLAFSVQLQQPDSPVTTIRNPSATLRFEQGAYNLNQIGCFANGEPLPMRWLDQDNGVLALEPRREFSGRRWRYLCTAPLPGSGRYFWYSIQWIYPGP